jgi:hypothetical protein
VRVRIIWPTPECQRTILVRHVLPLLPPGAIWECACGEREALAEAMRAAGRIVHATDLYRDGINFLTSPPPASRFAAAVTNSPFGKNLNHFIRRGLVLLDSGVIEAFVLLWRWDHFMCQERVPWMNRAAWVHHLTERVRWIEGSKKQPRWDFAWITWMAGDQGPPRLVSYERDQPRKRRSRKHDGQYELPV